MASRQIRPIRVEGNVAYVPLTRGCEAIIDAADVPLVEGRNWFAFPSRNTVYARSSGPKVGGRQRAALMHRILAGTAGDLVTDHRDGNGLNNRRANLRVATPQENTWNGSGRINSKSGVKGVHWRCDCRKWQAQIALDGQKIGLGVYRCRTAAQLAYAKASGELHGEFGRIA